MYNYMSSIDNVTIDSSVSFNDPGKNLFTTVRPPGFAVVFPSIYVSSIEVYKQSHLSIAYQLKKKGRCMYNPVMKKFPKDLPKRILHPLKHNFPPFRIGKRLFLQIQVEQSATSRNGCKKSITEGNCGSSIYHARRWNKTSSGIGAFDK